MENRKRAMQTRRVVTQHDTMASVTSYFVNEPEDGLDDC